MISRRTILQQASCLPLFSISRRAWSQPVVRPNILWILAEDLSPDLGCYGNNLVHTPVIDEFAQQGVLFQNAFVTCPVCSPSRSAFNTGMYQTTIGAHHHRSHRDDAYPLPDGVRLLSDYFREAGYFTANIKKLNDELSGTGKTDFNFSHSNPFDRTHWNQRSPGQPFFAQINLSESHRKFVRDPQRSVSPDDVEIPPYYPDHPITRQDWVEYLETNQVLDRRVAAILDALRQDGLEENTIVVFMGDNGRCHVRGKQWLYEGGIRVPLIVRWPDGRNAGTVEHEMISSIDVSASLLAMAGIEPPEQMQGRAVLTGDSPWRSMIFSTRDRCDETMDRIRCVRTRSMKLIRNHDPERPYLQLNRYKETSYPVLRLMRRLHADGTLSPEASHFMAMERPAEELYDLAADPHEVNNLVDDPAYRDSLQSMRRFLDHWIEESGDMGEDAEDPAVAKQFEQQMIRNYDKRLRELYASEGMDWVWGESTLRVH